MNEKHPPTRRSFTRILFFFLLLALVFCRFVLQTRLPLFARPNSWADDTLLDGYAYELVHGNGLGPYVCRFHPYSTALEKHPGFSFFLAGTHLLRIPYLAGVGALWCFACLWTVAALRPVVRSRWWRLAMLTLLLFSPYSMDVTSQRAHVLAIVAPISLLLGGSFIGWIFRRNAPLRTRLPWIAGASFSLGFYGVLRADYIWTLAMAAGAAAILALAAVLEPRGTLRRVSLCRVLPSLLVPFFAFAAATNALRTWNAAKYGVFATNDFTETGFSKACLALMSVKPEREEPMVYVAKDAFERAASQSPALSRIFPELKARLYQPRGEILPNGEVMREWYAWWLRWVAASPEYGIYTEGAVEADRYFLEMASEIETALSDGRLPKRKALILSPFTGPLTPKRFCKIILYALRVNGREAVARRQLSARRVVPEDGPTLNMIRQLTRQEPPSDKGFRKYIRVVGSLVSEKPGRIAITVKDKRNHVHKVRVSPRGPAGASDPEHVNDPYFDFAITDSMMDLDSAIASVRVGDSMVWSGPLTGLATVAEPSLHVFARTVVFEPDRDQGLPPADWSVPLANRLIAAFRFVFPPVFFAAILLHVFRFFRLFRGKRAFSRSGTVSWTFATVILLSAFSVCFLASANFFEAWPDTPQPFYILPAYSLLDLFSIVVLATCRIDGESITARFPRRMNRYSSPSRVSRG